MDEGQYYKDGVARVIELLRNEFGDFFKQYYDAEPAEIAESSLPCVMVSETTGEIVGGATGTDDITESILITVALNRKDDVGAPEGTSLTETRVRRLVKGMDPATQAYMPQTIMYALRTYITMDDMVIQSRIQTDFQNNILRGEDTVTQEGYVTLTIQRLALVPSRT